MQKGSIEVICGSMFSGKTEELLRRLKRADFAKLKVEIYKPIVDTRYDNKKIVSHDDNSINSIIVEKSSDILNLTKNPEVVAIDDQFLHEAMALRQLCPLEGREQWLQVFGPHVHPDDPALIDGRVRRDVYLVLVCLTFRGVGQIDAIAVHVKLPAVVDAAQSALFIATEE